MGLFPSARILWPVPKEKGKAQDRPGQERVQRSIPRCAPSHSMHIFALRPCLRWGAHFSQGQALLSGTWMHIDMHSYHPLFSSTRVDDTAVPLVSHLIAPVIRTPQHIRGGRGGGGPMGANSQFKSDVLPGATNGPQPVPLSGPVL